MSIPVLILKSKKDQAVRRLHPWIFSNAVKSTEGDPVEGDVVQILSNKGKLLGYGHFQDQGSIAVRMISFGEDPYSDDLFENRIRIAWNSRIQAGLLNSRSNCFRLVFAEGDGLPGLIADYYNGYVVLQFHSSGMYHQRERIVDAIMTLDGVKGVYNKSGALLSRFGLDAEDGVLAGDSVSENEVMENGHKFLVNWVEGQKTGFFLDQRDNRALLARYAKNRSVLNTFCYTGGFSVYALTAGASRVDSVDSSQPALDMLDRNLRLNGLDKHNTINADAMDFIKELPHDYDTIVLDPPAFAKSRSARHNAVQGYKRLNATVMRQMKPGSVLFTFSCSQVVDPGLFRHTIVSAGLAAERTIRILHQMSQPADHPISLYHPEGEYLKGLVLEVL